MFKARRCGGSDETFSSESETYPCTVDHGTRHSGYVMTAADVDDVVDDVRS